jgi:anti-anti-sigma factor
VALAQSQPETTVCTVTGTINKNTMPILRDALTEARRDNNAHLVIDLSAVTSINSAGLHTLLEARHEHNLSGGGHLAVVIGSNSPVILFKLRLAGLKVPFDVHHDLIGALHACTNAGIDNNP